MRSHNLEPLQQALHYTFQDPQRLHEALTHRSAGQRHNERLEFLGDSILTFMVADLLYHRFPSLDEGRLTRLRALLVREESLAELARQLQIGSYLHLGAGELKSGNFRRSSILADAFEAIIGAIYLDSDEPTVRRVVEQIFTPQLATMSPDQATKDPKTRLQEYLQSRALALPCYEVIAISGEAHCQQFTVRCTLTDLAIPPVEATAASRRKAEQLAATHLIDTFTRSGESL